MARWIESIILSVFLCAAAFLVISNLDKISYAVMGADADPLAGKPHYSPLQIAQEVHSLVNEQRAGAGLEPLEWDGALAIIAEGHSMDMAQRGFFDHVNPDGASPTDRGLDAGYNCTRYFDAYMKSGIAENIHQNNLYTTYDYRGDSVISYNWSTVEEIAQKTVDDWMKSPDHRKNIMNPDSGKEGIGVYIDAEHKVWITQNFC